MYCLRIFHAGKSTVVPLQDSAVTLGSSRENEVALDHPELPPLALRLTLGEDGYTVTAVHPRWKPVINGKRAESGFMRIGDRLELGGLCLVLDLWPENPGPGKPEAAAPDGTGPDFPRGLSRLCAMVAEERDLKSLLEKIMRLLLDVMGGNEAFLFHLDAAGRPQVMVSSREGDSAALFSDTVVREVLGTRRGLFIRNALSDPAYSRSQSISDLRLHSVLCCPILAGGKLSGLVYLGSNLPAVSFDERDLRELEVYSLVAGCLINHVEYITRQNLLLASLRAPEGVSGVVAGSPAMKKVMEEVQAVAGADISVLLLGETGTGKDVMAHLIHKQGRRRDRPFLVVNCSTLRGELLASELFGHKKGAFTGALQDQQGLFVAAGGGTLFLDEIGELDANLQAMLLRALETGMVRPVGQTSEVRTDVRLLSATNRDLEKRVADGLFRRDLYYRLNQHSILLPPLRERGEDIFVLAGHFLEKTRHLYPEKRIAGFHPDSLPAMARYAWPGNVRELANVVHKAILFAQAPLLELDLQDRDGKWASMDEATQDFQRDYLQKAMNACGGDREKTAALLGMGRSTLFRYLALGRQGAQAHSETDQ